MSVAKDEEGNIYISTDDSDYDAEEAAEEGTAIDDDDSSSSSSSDSSSSSSSSEIDQPDSLFEQYQDDSNQYQDENSDGIPDSKQSAVTVTGDASEGGEQTVVGRGSGADAVEESEVDAAVNQGFDAAEGTEVDTLEERLGSDPTRTGKSVTVTGDASKGQRQRVVGTGESRFASESEAARNPRFDAAEGTRVDALETGMGRGQGDGTELNQAFAADTRQSNNNYSRERSERPEDGALRPVNIGDSAEFSGFNQTRNFNDELDFTGSQRVLTPESVESQRDYLPGRALNAPGQSETFIPRREYASGTDIEGQSFLTQDLPEEGFLQLQPVDFGAGEKGASTYETVQNVDFLSDTQRENIGIGAGIAVTGGVQAAEGIASLPSFLQTAFRDPDSAAEGFVKGVSEDVEGGPATPETPEEFRREAGQVGLAVGALAGPSVAAGSSSRAVASVSGITDDAGIGTAAFRASGADDVRRGSRAARSKASDFRDSLTRNERQVLDDFEQAESDFAGQVVGSGDSDAFVSPDELEGSGFELDQGSRTRNFMGESFRPETGSFRDIVRGETPRSVPDDVEVLNPGRIEDVDPVSLNPVGGTQDVTPTLSRREALRQKFERSFESDRQTAQFEVQGLLDEGDGLFQTRKGQAQLIQKQKPKDVDTGVESPESTRRRIGRDDRRTDVADNQFSFSDDFDAPQRPRSRDSPSVDTPSGVARPAAIASFEQETQFESVNSQVQDQGPVFSQEQDQGQDFEFDDFLQQDTTQDSRPRDADSGIFRSPESPETRVNRRTDTSRGFDRPFRDSDADVGLGFDQDQVSDSSDDFVGVDTGGEFASSLTALQNNVQADEDFEEEEFVGTGFDIRPLL